MAELICCLKSWQTFNPHYIRIFLMQNLLYREKSITFFQLYLFTVTFCIKCQMLRHYIQIVPSVLRKSHRPPSSINVISVHFVGLEDHNCLLQFRVTLCYFLLKLHSLNFTYWTWIGITTISLQTLWLFWKLWRRTTLKLWFTPAHVPHMVNLKKCPSPKKLLRLVW